MFEYMWNILRSNGSKIPNGRLKSDLVAETLLEELESCMREVDACQRQKEAQSKRDSGVPDYSWLVSNSEQPYKIPNLLKIELEDLTTQIDPDDTSRVIINFRKSVTDFMKVQDIPECFKSVLKRHIVIKNLKTVPKDKEKIKNLHSFNEPTTLLRPGSDLSYLREKEARIDVNGSCDVATARVSSAPASSWRFFRQSKIKPVDSSKMHPQLVSGNEEKDRRAVSVPTITTIV